MDSVSRIASLCNCSALFRRHERWPISSETWEFDWRQKWLLQSETFIVQDPIAEPHHIPRGNVSRSVHRRYLNRVHQRIVDLGQEGQFQAAGLVCLHVVERLHDSLPIPLGEDVKVAEKRQTVT